MKKIVLLMILGVLGTSLTSQAQDLKRPKDAGFADYDKFKNDAFDSYEKSLKFKTMVESGDKFSAEDGEDVVKLGIALVSLGKSGPELLNGTSKIKNKLKLPKVVKNTKDGIKATKIAAENLAYIKENMSKAEE